MNFTSKIEEKKFIDNTYIQFNEKSRLIPNENNLLTQLNPIWTSVQ